MISLLAMQPFNSILEYPDTQAGKGTAITSFGCISTGTTAQYPGVTTQTLNQSLVKKQISAD